MTPNQGGKPYARSDHRAHGGQLLTSTRTTLSAAQSKADSALIEGLVFSILTAPETTVKAQKGNLSQIGFELISVDAQDKTKGIASIERSKLNNLEERIARYTNSEDHRGKTYFAPIEKIEEVDPITKIDTVLLEGDSKSCIIFLYPNLSVEEQNRVLQDISFDISRNKDAVSRFLKTSTSGFALTATLDPEKIVDLATLYNSIRSIRHNSSLRLEKAMLGNPVDPTVSVSAPLTNVKVGVVDSGIASSSRIISHLVSGRHAALPPGVHLDTSHGTLVASRIAFGDNLQDQLDAKAVVPVCKLVDIPIFWNDPITGEGSFTEADLIDLLNNFIPVNPDVRIFNLSFGNYQSISDFTITPLANELDNLSKKYDVSFVIASGNMLNGKPHNWDDYNTYKGSPESRINSPAESVLGITVGSYAATQNDSDIAPPNRISPFSRVGPGMDGNIKPELVSVGGNCYTHRGNGLFRPESSAVGLDASGTNISYNIGTSFSAPIVSHFASQILNTDMNMSTNLLKCYLIHFASNTGLSDSISGGPDMLYGFGEFQMADFISNSPDRMIFTHQGQLSSENYMHIPFHIPSSLDSVSGKRMKIRFTIVHDPDVDSANPAEYCMSDIMFSLEKNYSGNLLTVSGSNKSVSKYSSKWYPIIKYERVFEKAFSAGNWELRLRLNTRGNLDKDYKQSFAMIIELIDETNTIDFFKDFLREHGAKYSMSKIDSSSVI